MITIALPTPYGLKFRQWGSLVAEQLAEYGVLAPTTDEWQEWGSFLLNIPDLAFIPTPQGFADWQTWACRVLETTS